MFIKMAATFLLLVLSMPSCEAGDLTGIAINRWSAKEAKQAVAVDNNCFYTIGNAVLGKYNKQTGVRLASWSASDELPLTHLNSGVVIDGKLYCAHSNYPAQPEASSVEIFDAETLKHVGNHSSGVYEGSLTWIDRHDNAWWAVFAHYSKNLDENPYAKPHT